MDDSFSTILYIIITIVILLTSLLGKKKKPGKAPPGAAGRPPFMDEIGRHVDLLDLFEEKKATFTDENPAEPISVESQESKIPEPFLSVDVAGAGEEGATEGSSARMLFQGEAVIPEGEGTPLFQSEGSKVPPEMKNIFLGEELRDTIAEEGMSILTDTENFFKDSEIADIEVETKRLEEKKEPPFDARQAVIYSSILNRKYE